MRIRHNSFYNVLVAVFLSVILLCSGCGSISDGNSTGKIGVIGAMDEEVSYLKGLIENKKTTEVADMEFCEGTLDGKKVVIVQCGMGKVNAGICANTLINEFGCSEIINTGVAGSLQDQIGLGDIVVSVDAVQHDFTVEAIGFAKGEIPYTGLYAFPADESMRKTAVDAARSVAPDIEVFEGRVCTGDQFISTDEQKEKILSDFGGLCCEMEGGAIAQVCHLNKTPFVIIRAISDTTDDAEYENFMESAALNSARIVEYMVGNL
jgi:adenosylhomocysteine nucleosidase